MIIGFPGESALEMIISHGMHTVRSLGCGGRLMKSWGAALHSTGPGVGAGNSHLLAEEVFVSSGCLCCSSPYSRKINLDFWEFGDGS